MSPLPLPLDFRHWWTVKGQPYVDGSRVSVATRDRKEDGLDDMEFVHRPYRPYSLFEVNTFQW